MAVGKIAVVALDAGQTLGQARGLDALPSPTETREINRAQRDASAGDRQQPCQVAEGCAHTAAEVDDMWRFPNVAFGFHARGTTSAMRSSTK